MPQVIQCSGCGRRLKVPDNVIGKQIKCPACAATTVAAAVDDKNTQASSSENARENPKPAPQASDNFQHIYCPHCENRLKLLRKLLGKEMKCPECGVTFIASAERPAREEGIWIDPAPLPKKLPPPPPPRSRYDDDDPPEDDEDEPMEEDDDDFQPRRRRRGRVDVDPSGAVMPPAICLLITGMLGILINLFQFIAAIALPDLLQQNNQFFQTPPWASALSGLLFTILSGVTTGSAVAMLKGKFYGFCMTGAILAMINIGNCCCLLGVPFGIWALIVLARPEVKDSF